MKLGPVTKLDKINTTTWKKFDDESMSENCVVIVIYPIMASLEQFGVIWIQDV